jgi:hypothetical protein
MEPVAVERFVESSERESIIMALEMRVAGVHDVRFFFPEGRPSSTPQQCGDKNAGIRL